MRRRRRPRGAQRRTAARRSPVGQRVVVDRGRHRDERQVRDADVADRKRHAAFELPLAKRRRGWRPGVGGGPGEKRRRVRC